jgi:hypothetical protein
MRTIAKVIESEHATAVTRPWTGQTSRGVWSWGGADGASAAL